MIRRVVTIAALALMMGAGSAAAQDGECYRGYSSSHFTCERRTTSGTTYTSDCWQWATNYADCRETGPRGYRQNLDCERTTWLGRSTWECR